MSRFIGSLSHDRLTDLLDKKWDSQKLLNSFAMLGQYGDYLIIDDTIIPKPHSKSLDGFGCLWDHSKSKVVYAIGLVLLMWTNGKVRVPIAYKIYRKGGTKRIELALELISYDHLKLKKIQDVIFDYNSKES